MQGKRYCFTLNNYTDEEYEAVLSWDVKYLIVGKEVGESGTPHLQGYVIWATTKRLAAMKKLNCRAHWELARGSTDQNVEYCSKGEDFVEKGDRPAADVGEAEKERWKRAREIAVNGGDMDEIPDDIYVRYYRTLKEIRKDHMDKPPDADGTTGLWFVGAPGTGKSRTARDEFPGSYLKMQNKWWDGYQGEKSVLLDDLDSKELGHLLKIWSDRYSFLAETKGGAIHIRPEKIIVTSNYKIEDLWCDNFEMMSAIRRRFEVRVFTKP